MIRAGLKGVICHTFALFQPGAPGRTYPERGKERRKATAAPRRRSASIAERRRTLLAENKTFRSVQRNGVDALFPPRSLTVR